MAVGSSSQAAIIRCQSAASDAGTMAVCVDRKYRLCTAALSQNHATRQALSRSPGKRLQIRFPPRRGQGIFCRPRSRPPQVEWNAGPSVRRGRNGCMTSVFRPAVAMLAVLASPQCRRARTRLSAVDGRHLTLMTERRPERIWTICPRSSTRPFRCGAVTSASIRQAGRLARDRLSDEVERAF